MLDKVISWMILKGVLLQEQSELFVHSLTTIKHYFTLALILLFMGRYLGCTYNAIAFLILFPMIRRRAGGLHANSQFGCMLMTIFVFLAAHIGTLYINNTILLLAAGCACNSMLLSAPVDLPNNHLNLRQSFTNQHFCRIILIIAWLISLYCYSIHNYSCFKMILIIMILNGAGIIIQKPLQFPLRKYTSKKILTNLINIVLLIGATNINSACDVWYYQYPISDNLRKYVDSI